MRRRSAELTQRLYRSRWSPLLAAGVLLAIYYWEVLVGGKLVSGDDLVSDMYLPWIRAAPPGFEASNPALTDSVVSLGPAYTFVRESLASGQLPLWSPYTEFGMPFFQQSQWGLLSPAQLPLLAFPSRLSVETAQTVTGILKIAIAGGGAYLLARRIGCTGSASLFAAVAYMFGGYTTVWLSMPASAVTAFLPWICLAIEVTITGRRPWYAAAGLAAASAAAVLGGHPEIVVFVVAGALVYGAVRLVQEVVRGRRRELLPRVGALGVGPVLGVGICAVMLLPAMELLGHSLDEGARAVLYKDSFLPWDRLLHVFDVDRLGSPIEDAPELGVFYSSWAAPWYVGIVAVVVALFGLIRLDRRLLPFLAVLALTVTIVMNLWPYRVLLDLSPTLAGVYKPNALGLWSFALAMCAGIGADRIHRLLSGRIRARPWIATAVVSVLVVALFAELYAWGKDFNPRIPKGEVGVGSVPAMEALPRGAGAPRTVFLGNNMRAMTPRLFGFEDIRGYGQPTRADYDEFFRTVITTYPPNVYATDTGYKIPNISPHALEVLRASGVKYAAWSDGTWQLPGFGVTHRAAMHVATAGGASGSRAYVVHDYDVVPDRLAAMKRVADRRFDPDESAILAKRPANAPAPADRPAAESSARVTKYRNNEVELEVTASRPGVLVLADSFYPGWSAEVDGRDTEIVRANGLFRAVAVPAGTSKVRFDYSPGSLKTGFAITLVSLIATVALALVGRRRRSAGGV